MTTTLTSTGAPPRSDHRGPVKFEVYRQGKRVSAFEPVGAVAMGPESVPIPAEVSFRDGLLVVNRKDEQPVGVSLLWEVGPNDTLYLETTRLQPREKPYVLNVELARFRLMKIMQKQEDWNLFDFGKSDKFLQRFAEAQSLFSDALGRLHEPAVAAALADKSLEVSIDLSEQLAAFHAELLINRRRAANGFVKHIFGCRVDSTVQNEKYRETLAANFDYAIVPMGWKQLQPQEHQFNTDPVDDWIEWLSKKRLPAIAGPLIRLGPEQVPDWMVIWEHDFDMLRELAYEYVQKIVTRYRRGVAVWNVASGVPINAAFTLSFEQVIELTRLLVSQVKSILPNARTIVTINQPFGEYHARGRGSVHPLLYAEMVSQAGINFDAFGIELEMGVPRPGMFVRDLFQISTLLDRYGALGRPIFLTAVGVPGRWLPDPSDESEGRLNPSAAGQWRRPWDPELQAEWMEAVYHVALSKPFVESMAWGNLADLHQTLPGGGLLDDMLRPKPSLQKIQQLREKFRRK
jgi:hypothetical protein